MVPDGRTFTPISGHLLITQRGKCQKRDRVNLQVHRKRDEVKGRGKKKRTI